MILYYSNNFKSGLKVIFENIPYCIEDVQFVKPGKGQTFSRVKLRNLLTKQLIEKTFRPTDHLNNADIIDVSLIYIYNNKNFYYFMNKKNFEQFEIKKNIIKDNIKWMVEQTEYTITFWNNQPISMIMGNFVELQVIDINPIIKSNIYSNLKNTKLCKLNTGYLIQVPLFIQKGDVIKIDVRTGKYNSRIN